MEEGLTPESQTYHAAVPRGADPVGGHWRLAPLVFIL